MAASRAKNKAVNLLPERTDMTEEQLKDFMKMPIDEVRDIAKDELSDYSEMLSEIGLGETVDFINEEIRANASSQENLLVNEPDAPDAPEQINQQRKGRKKKKVDIQNEPEGGA